MNTGMRGWVLLALSLGCSNAMALLAIEGTVVIEPAPATLLRGEIATLTYTITNTGDEPLDFATAGTGYYEQGPTSTVLPMPNAATPPCSAQFLDFSPLPGQPTFVINTNSFYPRPIPAGESRQCAMELMVSPEAGGPFVQWFGFTGIRGTQNVHMGQYVAFNLGQGAVAVPAGGWLYASILALLVFLLGARSQR